MSECTILSIQVGKPQVLQLSQDDAGDDRTWKSGIFKSRVEGPIWLGDTNLEGDGQANLVHHGGLDRALLVFAAKHYARWSEHLGRTLDSGSFGENWTVDSLDEDSVCMGDRWGTGDVEIEISQPRVPCVNLSRRLSTPGLHQEIMDAGHGGWYARVMRQGFVEAGERLTLLERRHPDWPVSRAYRVYMDKQSERQDAQELASLPCLSLLWVETLGKRIQP